MYQYCEVEWEGPDPLHNWLAWEADLREKQMYLSTVVVLLCKICLPRPPRGFDNNSWFSDCLVF